MRQRISLLAAIPLLLAAAALSAPAAWAQEHDRGDVRSAQDRVNDSVQVIDKMKQDPHLAHLLQRARGVFIVAHYGSGGFIIGGQGGTGVVLAKRAGTWSDPAFFDIGGGSIGLQAGGSGGSVVMMLMTPRAVDRFENTTGRWSLNGGADLTVVTYSDQAEANGDVIVWSDTRGLYGGLTASVTHISANRKLDDAYYHHDTDSRKILSGAVQNHRANELLEALGTRVATR